MIPAWSPDRDAVLAELKASGASSTVIAMRMGTTRNSIIGRWWRLRRGKWRVIVWSEVKAAAARIRLDGNTMSIPSKSPERTEPRVKAKRVRSKVASRIAIPIHPQPPGRIEPGGTDGTADRERHPQAGGALAGRPGGPKPVSTEQAPAPSAPHIGRAHLGACSILARRMGEQCGWVLDYRSEDDHALAMVCGRATVETKEYCAEHYGLMFQPRAVRYKSIHQQQT